MNTRNTFHAIIIIALMLFIIPVEGLKAQPQGNKGIEITPYVGYMFGGTERYANGEFKIDGAFTYGAMISYSVRTGMWVEFAYSGSQTEGRTILWNEIEQDEPVDIGVNYFLIQGRQVFRTNSAPFRPFALYGLGAAYYNGKDTRSDDAWAFGASLGLGANYDINERIGIRVQARMLMPMRFGGVGFGCGIGTGGGGCGSGVSTYATMVQGDIGGGIVIRL